jgi:hypothetical protein
VPWRWAASRVSRTSCTARSSANCRFSSRIGASGWRRSSERPSRGGNSSASSRTPSRPRRARHFGELRGRVEAGERGRDLRARSQEQERDNKATEAERRRDGKAVERDRRAAEAERERDRRAAEAAALRDRKSAAGEASRAPSRPRAHGRSQRRELQQRADAQLAEYDAKMQEFKDQMMALMRPPAPAPSSGAVPGGVTDRLRKLYDDD